MESQTAVAQGPVQCNDRDYEVLFSWLSLPGGPDHFIPNEVNEAFVRVLADLAAFDRHTNADQSLAGTKRKGIMEDERPSKRTCWSPIPRAQRPLQDLKIVSKPSPMVQKLNDTPAPSAFPPARSNRLEASKSCDDGDSDIRAMGKTRKLVFAPADDLPSMTTTPVASSSTLWPLPTPCQSRNPSPSSASSPDYTCSPIEGIPDAQLPDPCFLTINCPLGDCRLEVETKLDAIGSHVYRECQSMQVALLWADLSAGARHKDVHANQSHADTGTMSDLSCKPRIKCPDAGHGSFRRLKDWAKHLAHAHAGISRSIYICRRGSCKEKLSTAPPMFTSSGFARHTREEHMQKCRFCGTRFLIEEHSEERCGQRQIFGRLGGRDSAFAFRRNIHRPQ
ncbi:hypothetical protein DFH11DRAFT_844034 [Phellopilus nigrolimitatus]|nr:hypothetical protein DFH11DRAFT_844034 [Phellopilus nigrolimitatus]